ncbi:MAG: DUF5658 family protein [bacterium]
MASAHAYGKSVMARWSRIREFAKHARQCRRTFYAAAIIALLYNFLGCLDIVSTIAGLQAQAGEEANPFVKLLMDNIAHGWILAKLALQFFVTIMILWFPHRLVLSIFSITLIIMSFVVWNNFQLAGIV